MRNKHTVRIIAIVLAFIMLFSVIYGAISSLTANAAVTQAQIDKLKSQKKDLDKKKQEIQSKINTIEYEQMTAVAKKNVLDDRILLTEMEIEGINELILQYIDLIAEKETEVVEAQAREDEQWRRYKSRIRAMEENGVISYLAVIFDSSSFSDMLAKIDIVGNIMKNDEKIYAQLTEARLDTIAAKEDLEQAVLEQETEREALELKYTELNEQIAESSAFIEQIIESLDEANALYDELNAEEETIQKEINEKVEELKRQEAARAAAAAAAGNSGGSSGGAKGTGKLLWPAPASHIITSRYGLRWHPVSGVYRQHTGIDIGAGYGTNVLAADTGTVITSTYNSSYGNYVVISHGGMTTLYAHMSSRKVKVGDSVNKGDVVGLVGSTGVSTGPHLHFEVSVGGSRVNPADYFSGYVVSD